MEFNIEMNEKMMREGNDCERGGGGPDRIIRAISGSMEDFGETLLSRYSTEELENLG